ncbi:MAG: membrane protein insertase YidC [Candidatus Binatia bacterium]
MEKRALIAVVLSLLILILYQAWVSRFYGPPPAPEQEEKTLKEVIPSPPRPLRKLYKPKAKPVLAGAQGAVKDLRVETDRYIALFTNRGARLKSLLLKHYRVSAEEQSAPFEMVPSTPGVPFPLGIQLHDPTPFNDEGLVYNIKDNSLRITGDAKGTLTFQTQTPWGAPLIKKFTFTGSSYVIGLELSVGGANGSKPPSLLLSTNGNNNNPTRDAVFEGLLALVDGKLITESGKGLAEGKELSGPIAWAGFGYTYFLFALLPEDETNQRLTVKQEGPGLLMDLRSQTGPGAAGKTRYNLFIGPKDLDVLTVLGKGLERSINFGYFAFVSAPLLHILRFSHRLTASYGIDIILLTILIKLLLAPLTHKSFVSMKQMQKLQPQMQRIKEKFKDDKERMNKEVMDLYRRNKVNPLGGCLPMLLQFPVFIGLYNALRTPIELRHAPFLWIKDLSRPDWESLPITLWGWKMGIPVLVLLMGGSMFVQQWMTPSAGDPNQRRMMLMMPLIFTVMFVNFPSGLTIYWLVNNILTIGQQYIINRMTR